MKSTLKDESVEKIREILDFYFKDKRDTHNAAIQIAQELSQVEANAMESRWRGFESAPKDREILVCYPNQGYVKKLVKFSRVYGYWYSKGKAELNIEHQKCLWIDIPALTKVK